jgi:pimeloyl-ACP methyl ester carboxylesterase
MLPVLLAFALAVGCGGHGQRGATTQPAGSVPVSGGAGGLVSIGGGRSLYVECVGSGDPLVVLEAGFPGNGGNWRDVQPELGRTTRTCAYDRAGLGHSPPMPGVHDAQDEIDDLQRLLVAAHITPPYVLVGHSYGGILVRLFARQHPEEAAGVVLVDARGRDATRRQLALLPKSQIPPVLAMPGLLRWLGRPSGEETDRVINSRSGLSAPAGYRFPREVIAVAVRWYLRYGLSYRDVEELLAERGIEVDHVTV